MKHSSLPGRKLSHKNLRFQILPNEFHLSRSGAYFLDKGRKLTDIALRKRKSILKNLTNTTDISTARNETVTSEAEPKTCPRGMRSLDRIAKVLNLPEVNIKPKERLTGSQRHLLKMTNNIFMDKIRETRKIGAIKKRGSLTKVSNTYTSNIGSIDQKSEERDNLEISMFRKTGEEHRGSKYLLSSLFLKVC